MSRFTVINAEQRSPEWYAARAGRATASRAAAVRAKPKSGSGEAVTRRDYRIQLAVERLTGVPQESDFVNKDMQRGIDMEPMARMEYEARSGQLVTETGFLSMTEYLAGCSLDGHVDGMKGLVSFKCPKSATHVEYAKAARLPPEYVAQATHEMWVTGAEWYDFVSFDDRLPEWLQYFCVRIYRNEFDLKQYEAELNIFLREVEAEVSALKKLKERMAA